MSVRTPLVQCTDIARTYGSGRTAVVALHGASCAVYAGDKVAIVGPSGSGKSTLLHLLAGIDAPTHGVIEWPAFGAQTSLRPWPVAVVFQGPSLLPALDVIENVALPVLLLGVDRETATAAAHVALERLGLDDLVNKLPEELSGGQAQRVAVARALATSPRLILADEPTGQLDHASAAQVVDALVSAAGATGAALVVTTHDRELAARLTRAWEMSDGRLRTDDPTHGHLREAPCSA